MKKSKLFVLLNKSFCTICGVLLLFLLSASFSIAATPATWFNADAITGITSGSALQTWPDASGNGFDATQSTVGKQPTYISNGMNGHAVVRFNNASSTALFFNRPVQDDFTIICVFQSTQGLNSGNLFWQGAGLVNGEVGGSTTDFGTCLFANGSICAGTGNPDVAANSAAGYNDGKPHVMVFERTQSTGLVSLYVDSTLAGTTTGSTASLTAPAQLALGAQSTSLYYLSGDIAEVQLFTSVLSDTDRQIVEGSLSQKYNILPPAPNRVLCAIAKWPAGFELARHLGRDQLLHQARHQG